MQQNPHNDAIIEHKLSEQKDESKDSSPVPLGLGRLMVLSIAFQALMIFFFGFWTVLGIAFASMLCLFLLAQFKSIEIPSHAINTINNKIR